MFAVASSAAAKVTPSAAAAGTLFAWAGHVYRDGAAIQFRAV
jgi:hypothetical protein